MYREEKTSQIAASFVSMEGGVIPHLKLIKLLYIADRESMKRTGFPLTFDIMKSLPHGPILDSTLSHIDNKSSNVNKSYICWNSKVINRGDYAVELVTQDLLTDSLSEDDLEVLRDVYAEYGHLTKYQLRDLTHDPKKFPEWCDPKGSSLPISYKDIFLAFGKSEETALLMADQIKTLKAADDIFDSL